LSSKASGQIEQHVQAYLDKPHVIHQMNAAAIRSGNLNLENFPELERYFWNQVRQPELESYVYFGNEQGEFIGVERIEDAKTVVKVRDKSTANDLKKYELATPGNRTNPTIVSKNFDPRVRDWYKAAQRTRKPTWSPIYPFVSQPIPGITPAMPIIDNTGKFRGVLGIDLSLKQISDFLSNLQISKSGKAFIIEPSGEIVASSILDTRFLNADKKRLNATDSSQPLIVQRTTQHLFKKFGSLDRIDAKQPISSFQLDGKSQLVNVNRLQDGRGLDWLIVVVIPEADFLENFYSSALFTLFVGLAITGLAAWLGLVAAERINRPIFTLTDAAAAIEDETFDPKSLDAVTKQDDELGKLARCFQLMAVKVYDRQQRLRQQVQELDNQIGKFKKERQLAGMSETHYFLELLNKARSLRSQAKDSSK
jgi:hypothetical protein